MLSEKQKQATKQMVDRFLFEASAREIYDQDRLIRLMWDTLKPKDELGRETLEYAVQCVTTRTIKPIRLNYGK